MSLLKRHLERQKETFHTTCAQKLTPGEDFKSTFHSGLNSQRGVAPHSKKGPYLPYSKEVTRYSMNISRCTARRGLPPAAPRYCICSWAGKANKCTHTQTHTPSLQLHSPPRGISLRVLLALLCQLTISMRPLMHYKLIAHRGAEGVSHWRRLVCSRVSK